MKREDCNHTSRWGMCQTCFDKAIEEGKAEERERGFQAVMDLMFALRELGAMPQPSDLIALARRIRGRARTPTQYDCMPKPDSEAKT